jgi:hypothetical protein
MLEDKKFVELFLILKKDSALTSVLPLKMQTLTNLLN